jgi:hypothetical protein
MPESVILTRAIEWYRIDVQMMPYHNVLFRIPMWRHLNV